MTARAEFFMRGKPLNDGPFLYTLCGVPGIYLLNGVTIHEDDGYGPSFEIEDLDGLHEAIAAHIVERPGIMTGPEMRFIRKQMHATQAEFSKLMRVSSQTVANYEKGMTKLDGPADSLVRLIYVLHVLPPDAGKALIAELMEAVTQEKTKHHAGLRRSPIWDEVALAAA